MRKSLAILGIFAAILLGLSPGLAAAQEYPARPAGYVSDFAAKLTPAERENLGQELRAFDQRTTNEVVVVTVTSLNGQDIATYSRGLFQKWGIGKKDKNNGVMLLWAPAERKVRIEVGTGLEKILTDELSARIMNEKILPQFRSNRMAAGIVAGVRAIMTLTDVPAAAAAPAAPVSGGEPFNLPLPIVALLITVGLMAVGGLVWFLASASSKARAKENRERLERLSKLFAELKRTSQTAQVTIASLTDNNPPAVIEEAREKLGKTSITEIFDGFSRAESSLVGNSQGEAGRQLAEIEIQLNSWKAAIDFVTGLPMAIESARTEAEQALRNLPTLIAEIESLVGHADVSAQLRSRTAGIRKEFGLFQAEGEKNARMVNWRKLCGQLGVIERSVAQVRKEALHEKAIANEARDAVKKLLTEYHRVERLVYDATDVSGKTREDLTTAQSQSRDVRQKAEAAEVNWSWVAEEAQRLIKRFEEIAKAARHDAETAALARREVPALLRSLPDRIRDTEFKVVRSSEGRQLLDKARNKYQEAASHHRPVSADDFIFLYELLKEAQKLCERADEYANRPDPVASGPLAGDNFHLGVAAGAILASQRPAESQPERRSHEDPPAEATSFTPMPDPTPPTDVGGGGSFDGGGGTSSGGGADGSY